jgi:hypothetical protein
LRYSSVISSGFSKINPDAIFSFKSVESSIAYDTSLPPVYMFHGVEFHLVAPIIEETTIKKNGNIPHNGTILKIFYPNNIQKINFIMYNLIKFRSE